MNDTLKKALIIFGGGFIIFWLFKDKGIKNTSKEEKIDAPNIDPKELAWKSSNLAGLQAGCKPDRTSRLA